MGKNQTNNKSLEDRIVDDIKKTGYPTEIQSASKMINDGWTVFHNPSFLDKDEGTCREFDIEAIKTFKAKVGPGSLPTAYTPAEEMEMKNGIFFYTNIRLICECKKSDDKPWVFFISKEMNKSVLLNEYVHGNFSIDSNQINEKFKSHNINYDIKNSILNHKCISSSHHYFEKNYFARTFYEALKGNEESQQIYKAVMSCIKATLYYQYYKISNNFFINYPIIIFKGNLFTSSIVKNEIKVDKTNHVQLAYNYIIPYTIQDSPFLNRFPSPLGNRQKFIIDIVNFEYLDDFLKIINKESSIISTLIEDILK